MSKTIHIKRTIDIEITVPMNETQQETEQWIDSHFRPDGTLEKVDLDHIIRDIRMTSDEDDQDAVMVVSWPESQELSMYEGFYENCDFICGDTIEPCSYLVKKAWYGKLQSGELKKIEEYAA